MSNIRDMSDLEANYLTQTRADIFLYPRSLQVLFVILNHIINCNVWCFPTLNKAYYIIYNTCMLKYSIWLNSKYIDLFKKYNANLLITVFLSQLSFLSQFGRRSPLHWPELFVVVVESLPVNEVQTTTLHTGLVASLHRDHIEIQAGIYLVK